MWLCCRTSPLELASVLRARGSAATRASGGTASIDSTRSICRRCSPKGLAAKYTVSREQHYPSARATKKSARVRCDLVLERAGERPLWLEVKVAQQRREGGAHNARYAQQWRRAITDDLRKPRADAAIRDAALAFVAFTDDEATFEKDAATFERLLLDEELLCGWRSSSGFSITDRIGHTRCITAVWLIVLGSTSCE